MSLVSNSQSAAGAWRWERVLFMVMNGNGRVLSGRSGMWRMQLPPGLTTSTHSSEAEEAGCSDEDTWKEDADVGVQVGI